MLAVLSQFNAAQWGILIIQDVDSKVYAEVDIFQRRIIFFLSFAFLFLLKVVVCLHSNTSLLKELQHRSSLYHFGLMDLYCTVVDLFLDRPFPRFD